MKFVDYLNVDLLKEIAVDKDRLKDIAQRDNGYVLKKMEEYKIYPEIDFIRNINTVASIIFLFNNYEIDDNELIKYSKYFKDNSVVLGEINKKKTFNMDSFMDSLITENSSFMHPNFLLSKDDLIKEERKILKLDMDNSEKINYIKESINALSEEEILEIPLKILNRFPSIYDTRHDLLKHEKYLNHFKKISDVNNSFTDTTNFIYMKATGDLSQLNLLDNYSANFVKDIYGLMKNKNPSFTMTDLFDMGNNHIKYIIANNDLSNDLNVTYVNDYFYKIDDSLEVFGRFSGGMNPPLLKEHLNVCLNLNQYSLGIKSLSEAKTMLEKSPKTYIGGFYYLRNLLDSMWDEFNLYDEPGSKKETYQVRLRDGDGEKISFTESELKDFTSYFLNRYIAEKDLLNLHVRSTLFLEFKKLPDSLNKLMIIALDDGLDKENINVIKNRIKRGEFNLDKETLDEFVKLISDKDYYLNGGKLGLDDSWYGGLGNLRRNNQGKIEWDKNSMRFFTAMGQDSFIEETYMNGKAVFSQNYVEEKRKELSYDSCEFSNDFIKFIDKQDDLTLEMKSFINTFKKNKKLSYQVWGLPDEKEIIVDLLNVFNEGNDFISNNRQYFVNRASSDNEDNYSNDSPRGAAYYHLMKDIDRIRNGLSGISDKKKNEISELLAPKNYEQAFLVELILNKKDIKKKFLINDFNSGQIKFDGSVVFDQSEFESLTSENKISGFWKSLNETGKNSAFEGMVKILDNESFYRVFSLFDYDNPKSDWDKNCKKIILDNAPEKILYSKYNCPINLNVESIYEISKAITQNKSWNHRSDINSRFAEFLSKSWENSTVAEYENILERARKEDPASYSLLLAPSIFYSYNFEFKDNKENTHDFPFNGFKEFDKEQKEKYPEFIKLDYKNQPERESYLSFWYSKIDWDAATEGINTLRNDFAVTVAKDYSESGYSTCSFRDKTMSELFPLFVYMDYPRDRDDLRDKPLSYMKSQDKEMIVNFVDKLLEKDVANINLILNNYYIPQIYGIDNLVKKVTPMIDDIDSFRKVVLTVTSSAKYGKEEICEEYASSSNDGSDKRKSEFLSSCVENLLKDENGVNFLSYNLNLQKTKEDNFKRIYLGGSFQNLALQTKERFGSIESLTNEANEIKDRLALRNHIENNISVAVVDSEIDSGIDFGFKL